MLHRHQIHANFANFIKEYNVVFYLGKIKDVNITNILNILLVGLYLNFGYFCMRNFCIRLCYELINVEFENFVLV